MTDIPQGIDNLTAKPRLDEIKPDIPHPIPIPEQPLIPDDPLQPEQIDNVKREIFEIGQGKTARQGRAAETSTSRERRRNPDTDFFMFRHGITAEGGEEGIYGLNTFTAGITKEGRGTIQRTVRTLREFGEREGITYDGFYTSPMRRTKQTAGIVANEIGVQPITDVRLVGKSKYEPEWVTKQRLKSFLDMVERKGQKHVVITTHEKVISGLMSLLQEREHFSVSDRYKTGTVTIMGKDGTVHTIDADRPQN